MPISLLFPCPDVHEGEAVTYRQCPHGSLLTVPSFPVFSPTWSAPNPQRPAKIVGPQKGRRPLSSILGGVLYCGFFL